MCNNPKIFKIVFAFFIVSIYPNVAITQQWQWAKQISCRDYVGGTKATMDSFGNFFVTGSYSGELMDDTCYIGPFSLIQHGTNTIFLAKYDKNGNVLWAEQFNGFNNQPSQFNSITNVISDGVGGAYITGVFYDTIHFGTISLVGDYYGDIFLAKLDANGNCLWAKKGGGQSHDSGLGLAVDGNKNIYICGYCTDNAMFDTLSVGPGTFLAKYDSVGGLNWVKIENYSPAHSHQVTFQCMTISNDTLFINGAGGDSSYTIDTITVNNPGKRKIILSCFNLNGGIIWVKEAATKFGFWGTSMSHDNEGNIYGAGAFIDSLDFSGTIIKGNPDLDNAFLCKYSGHGTLLWARPCPSTGSSGCNMIVSDSNGNSYITGWFSGIGYFGSDTILSETNRDMFLARYNTSGDIMGVLNFGYAEGMGLCVDQDESAYVVGEFMGTINIGATSLTDYLYRNDVYVAKCEKITGIGEKKLATFNRLIIYANPNDGACSIIIPQELQHDQNLLLYIYNSQGILVQQDPVSLNRGKVEINISAEASGLYNAILTNGKKSYSGKIIFK